MAGKGEERGVSASLAFVRCLLDNGKAPVRCTALLNEAAKRRGTLMTSRLRKYVRFIPGIGVGLRS